MNKIASRYINYRYGSINPAKFYKPYNTSRSSKRKSGYSYSMTKTKRFKTTDQVGVSAQHDYKKIYQKKRMPWRKRRQWANFLKKNIAANLKLVGTRTRVFNNTIGNSITTPGEQNYVAIHLYGKNGTDVADIENGTLDLKTILQDNDISKTSKVLFGSAIMDLTIVNPNNEVIEVDLYEIFYLKSDAQYSSYLSAKDAAQTDTTNIPGSSTGLTLNSRGVTPFDLPQLTKLLGAKIYKKTKMFLPAQGFQTYQYRDSRNRLISASQIKQTVTAGDDYIYKNWTKTCLLVFKNLPGSLSESNALIVGCTRKYMYKIFLDNNDYDAYN